jgi:hypothetical protein
MRRDARHQGSGTGDIEGSVCRVPTPGSRVPHADLCTCPAATSWTGTTGLTSVPLAKVVCSAAPFHCTTEVERKPVP